MVSLKDMKVVEIPRVTSLFTKLLLDNGEKISVCNILMNMKAQTNYNTCIFSQVDQNYFERVQACVCTTEYDKTCFKVEYLHTILCKRFGQA